MTCFSPLSVLQLHCPKPHPANSVHLQKSRSRKIFLTPHSPSPYLLCSGSWAFFGECCLLQVLEGQRCYTGLLCVLILLCSLCSATFKLQLRCPCHIYSECDMAVTENSELGREDFPAPEKASVTAAPSAPLRVGGSAQNPSCALSQGTPFSSTSLPNFTGNPFLLLFFFN